MLWYQKKMLWYQKNNFPFVISSPKILNSLFTLHCHDEDEHYAENKSFVIKVKEKVVGNYSVDVFVVIIF